MWRKTTPLIWCHTSAVQWRLVGCMKRTSDESTGFDIATTFSWGCSGNYRRWMFQMLRPFRPSGVDSNHTSAGWMIPLWPCDKAAVGEAGVLEEEPAWARCWGKGLYVLSEKRVVKFLIWMSLSGVKVVIVSSIGSTSHISKPFFCPFCPCVKSSVPLSQVILLRWWRIRRSLPGRRETVS